MPEGATAMATMATAPELQFSAPCIDLETRIDQLDANERLRRGTVDWAGHLFFDAVASVV